MRIVNMASIAFVVLVVFVAATRAEEQAITESPSEHSVALSLRLATERGGQQIEILVKNVSHTAVEITSEGLAPPWSVHLWFKWKVDGKDAEYQENIAVIPKVKESRRIPPGGVVLWGSIPFRYVTVKTEAGYQSAIQDAAKHTVTVLGSERWKDLKVKPGTLEISTAPAQPATAPSAAKLPQQPGLSVRQRLQRSIDVSRTLAAKGQPSNDEAVRSLALEACEPSDRKKSLLFPRTEDVEAYTQARPWASSYAPNSALLRPMQQELNKIEHWPTQTDAPELRKLLEDKDPAMRCVAAEALATLHQPEDVERIGRLLKDDADGLPGLGWNRTRSARSIGGEEIVAGGLHYMRSWHNRTVADTARLALRLMTGVDLTTKDFDQWWQRNNGGRNCVWYWQQRLTRDLAAADALAAAAWQEDEPKDLKSYEAKRNRILAQKQQRFNAVRQAVAGELAQLPAEIEAKVRLAAINRYSTSLGVGLDEPLMGSFVCPRIGTDRLLELLEQKNLWDDVDWKNPCNYNNLAVQVVGRAELFFTREYLPRLRAIMDREHDAVWWSGQVAFALGISHLLPPATGDNLDDPKTREGWLRSRMRNEGELLVRGCLAAELVRVGLPENSGFLKKDFFAETGWKDRTDIRQSILKALGELPLTPTKLETLVEIVLDERFAPLWTQPNHRMGDDMYRQYAMGAVNAHAGKALLTDQDKYALTDPAKSEKALVEVLRKVATLRQEKNPEEPERKKMETKAKRDAATVMSRIRRAIETDPTLAKLSEILSEPDMDIGSGIHLFVYMLSDGTGITIGTSDKKKIFYVDHVGKRLFPFNIEKAHGDVPRPAADAKIDQWIKQLASEDRNARHKAADRLGDVGPAANRAIPALIVALKEEARRPKADSEMTATTEEGYAGCLIRVLAGFGKAAVPPLIEILKKEADLRQCVLGVLERIGADAEDAVPAVVSLGKDADDETRASAIETLGKIGRRSPQAIAAMIGALGDGFQPVRATAVRALGECGPGAKEAVPALIRAWKEEKDESVRQGILDALGLIGLDAKDAVPMLIDVLRHKEPIMRWCAARALGRIGPAAAMATAALKEAAGNEADYVRKQAAESLRQVSSPQDP